jgi:hypothetical protein
MHDCGVAFSYFDCSSLYFLIVRIWYLWVKGLLLSAVKCFISGIFWFWLNLLITLTFFSIYKAYYISNQKQKKVDIKICCHFFHLLPIFFFIFTIKVKMFVIFFFFAYQTVTIIYFSQLFCYSTVNYCSFRLQLCVAYSRYLLFCVLNSYLV